MNELAHGALCIDRKSSFGHFQKTFEEDMSTSLKRTCRGVILLLNQFFVSEAIEKKTIKKILTASDFADFGQLLFQCVKTFGTDNAIRVSGYFLKFWGLYIFTNSHGDSMHTFTLKLRKVGSILK